MYLPVHSGEYFKDYLCDNLPDPEASGGIKIESVLACRIPFSSLPST